jgi:hypothetical protein
VGATDVPNVEVSVTVAVQSVVCPVVTEDGVQLTVVDVALALTV